MTGCNCWRLLNDVGFDCSIERGVFIGRCLSANRNERFSKCPAVKDVRVGGRAIVC